MEEIRAGIERILGDPAFKTRCVAFAAETSTAPGLEKAVELIEALVHGGRDQSPG